MRTFNSNYSGRCPICAKRYDAGTSVVKTGAGYPHAMCVKDNADGIVPTPDEVDAAVDTIAKAVSFMVVRGAPTTYDDQGFNKPDWGMYTHKWSPDVIGATFFAPRLSKYLGRQLAHVIHDVRAAQGILAHNAATTVVEPVAAPVSDDVLQSAGFTTQRSEGDVWCSAEYSQHPTYAGYDYALRFPFALKDDVKEAYSPQWEPCGRRWHVTLDTLLKMASNADIFSAIRLVNGTSERVRNHLAAPPCGCGKPVEIKGQCGDCFMSFGSVDGFA